MNEITPGWQTTEFWVTTVSTILGIVASLGLISPEQAGTLGASIAQVIGGVIAIISVVRYLKSRTQVKVAAIGALSAERIAGVRSGSSVPSQSVQ